MQNCTTGYCEFLNYLIWYLAFGSFTLLGTAIVVFVEVSSIYLSNYCTNPRQFFEFILLTGLFLDSPFSYSPNSTFFLNGQVPTTFIF